MRPTMTIKGAGHVEMMMRNIARRVPDAARGQMRRSADRVVELAKRMVPEDTERLRDSIRIEKSYGTRGRLQINIVAGNQSFVSASGRTLSLNQYALLVHEAYETQVAKNGPGAKTRAKMQANPDIKIGSGFLTRAFEKEMARLEQVMIQVTKQVISQEENKG